MLKTLSTLRAMLLVAVIAAGVGGWGPPAVAKKPPAPVPQTGQTQCWDASPNPQPIDCTGTGEDGQFQAGVPFPTPRFTDNHNGTVTDNLTGLIWLRQANCFGAVPWGQALTAANSLASGQCGLTDGSHPGDWRLPNVRELHSLIDFGFFDPALSNTAGTGQCTATDCAFSGVQSPIYGPYYWSSTVRGVSYQLGVTFFVSLFDGAASGNTVGLPQFVWPVRGGL
jgi:Protein of unknown function (DUF1566)